MSGEVGTMGFEASGEWWLPENPKRRVGGSLRVGDDGEGELTLIGTLTPLVEMGEKKTSDGVPTVAVSGDQVERGVIYSRILGEAEGIAYTVDDSIRINWKIGLPATFEREKIKVGWIYRGIHFDKDERAEFNEVHVWMNWLAYWTGRSGLEWPIDYSKNSKGSKDLPIATLKLRSVADETIRNSDGSNLALEQDCAVSGDGILETKLTQDFYFSLTTVAAMEVIPLLEPISHLQCIVTNQKLSLRTGDIC